MSNQFELRQVAFAAHDLTAAENLLTSSNNWTSVGQDRHAEVFGLTSHLYQLGAAFIEILVPTQADSALARFLARHPGETVVPYMLLLHDTGINSGAYESVPNEWRVHATSRPGYRSMHLHPKSVPPLLTAVAQPESSDQWPLTAELIGRSLPSNGARFSEVVVEASDPGSVSASWEVLLGTKAKQVESEFLISGDMLTVRVQTRATEPRLTRLGIARGQIPIGHRSDFAGIEFF